MRFTQFYNTPRFCPTRASLLTGLYPHQTGIGTMMDDRGIPGYRGELNLNCLAIAEELRRADYHSATQRLLKAFIALHSFHQTTQKAGGSYGRDVYLPQLQTTTGG